MYTHTCIHTHAHARTHARARAHTHTHTDCPRVLHVGGHVVDDHRPVAIDVHTDRVSHDSLALGQVSPYGQDVEVNNDVIYIIGRRK